MVRWLSQHGAAVVQLNANFDGNMYKENTSEADGPTCWVRYDYGFNVLPMFLPNLTCLKASSTAGFMVAEHDLFSVQTLTSLQTLDLAVESNGTWNLQTLDPLQNLKALRALVLIVEGLNPKAMLLTAALSRLSFLTSLDLYNESPDVRDSRCTYDTQTAGDVISSLVLLQHLGLKCLVDSIPESFSRLQQLEFLQVGGDQEAWPDFVVPDSFSSCCKLTGLQLDLFAVYPESVDWLASCSVLAKLPSLSCFILDGVDLADIPAESWAFSNHLTSLYITISGLEKVPQALVSLTSLQELELSYNELVDLPAGPYLERLTQLHLSDCNFHAMPLALASATSLRVLHCRDNEPWVDVDKLKELLPQHCQLRF